MKHSLSSLWFYSRAICAFALLSLLALLVAWQDVTTKREMDVDNGQ